MRQIDDVILLFTRFLEASWDRVCDVGQVVNNAEAPNFTSDWLQANWEMLVEVAIGNVPLAIYGEGADVHPDSSRVFSPPGWELPTHVVVCLPKRGTSIHDSNGRLREFPPEGLAIDELGTVNEGYFDRGPPFDHVMLAEETERAAFRVDDVSFFVRPIRADEL
jgi:hypothetical protein